MATGKYKEREYNCSGCGDLVKANVSKSKKFCSRKCFDLYRPSRGAPEIECKCSNCENITKKRQSHIIKHKNIFCSRNCANVFQGNFKLSFNCKICDTEFKWTKSRLKTHTPKYCSIKCRNKCPEWKYNACIMGNLAQYKKKGINNLEILGGKLLREYGYIIEEQKLINDKILVDVYVPEYNLIIFWDGEYWHGHPTKLKNGIPDKRQDQRIKYDKSQEAYLLKCGYKILRFWESEVKKECVENNGNIRRSIQKITGEI